MSVISRRAALGSVLYAIPTAYVSNLDQIQCDADRLAAKMGAIHGGEWRAAVDHETGFILIKPRPRPYLAQHESS